MSDQFTIIQRANVVRSLTNPRTVFDPAYLQDLANSVKDHGIIQALLVRPLPASRVPDTPRNVTHEIVCGECRDRASEIAGVDEYPVMIKDLTDDQVLEIQLVENLKRRDLSELEEAQGYEKLMQHAHLNADQVAGKIGKSRAYVYGRLKLLDLSQECKLALREGKIKPSHALLIARIPDAKLQTKALAEATRPITATGDQFISERAFQSWLQANVMLRLDAATFAITDTRLVKDAGSCKDCPRRTGANPDLFAEVNSADLCTDPACYHAKADAHRAAMIAKAEAKGLRLVEGKEAKEICKPNTSKLDGYLPLSQVREDSTINVAGVDKKPTLRDLLGKDAPDPVLIEHPVTKELIEAVPTAEAEALLITRGLIKATQEQAKAEKTIQFEIDTLKRHLDEKVERTGREAIFQAVLDGIRTTPDARVIKLLDGEVLRGWFLSMLGEWLDADAMALMLGYTFEDGVDEFDALSMHIRASNTTTLLRALVIQMAMQDRVYDQPSKDGPPILNGLCATLQINAADITAQSKKAVKAETAQRLKALQAQLRSTTTQSVTTPADTSYQGEGGEPKTNKPTAKQPAPRKAKLTPAQALSGIAAAMQGDEHQATTASPGDISTPAATLPSLLSGFEVNQSVRVTTDTALLGPAVRKHAGRDGVIAKVLGDHCYQVRLSKGGSVPMYGKQLEGAAV